MNHELRTNNRFITALSRPTVLEERPYAPPAGQGLSFERKEETTHYSPGLMPGCSDRHSPFATTVPVIIKRWNLKAKSKSDWRIKPERPTHAGGKKREESRKQFQK
jgi:hypothetical protein